MSAMMWDTWRIYNPRRGEIEHLSVLVDEPSIEISDPDVRRAAMHEAISYAAYRLLKHRFANTPNKEAVAVIIDKQMASLNYSTELVGTVGQQPYQVGNRMAAAVIELGHADGACEQDE